MTPPSNGGNPEDMALVMSLLQQHAPQLANSFEDAGKCAKELRKFVTADPKMLALKKEIQKASYSNDCALIVGPSGTGKEILANALHGDRKGPFSPLNCAGLPNELAESELFGHAKGAFTGANFEKKGLFSAAENGTIFLDEIGELSMMIQAKLLRVLASKKARRVGLEEEYTVNCRVVCATHRDLEDMVADGKFREDLYWRISTLEFYTTPLEQRTADIELILDMLDTEHRIKDIEDFCAGINPKVLKGNVRALERIVRRFYVLGQVPQKYKII